MTINIAKLRAAATITATPHWSGEPTATQWIATVAFFGICATVKADVRHEAETEAIAKLAEILTSIANAIDGVSDS